MSDDVTVIVNPSTTPEIVVNVSDVGLPGRDGRDFTGLEDHINSPTPHPVYDDGPSLLLIYQNAKV